MTHVTRGLTVGIIVLLAGCRENTPVQPQQPGSIQALIVDGAHSGNKNFFFLPPLVPNPVGSPNFVAGQFNPNLAPVVEVCELTGDPTLATSTNPVDCKSPTDRVFGPASMALDAPNEQYTLNWDTKASALLATSFYRIIVRGARLGTPLGFLDVDPVVGGMKNLKTGEVVVFQDGRTLPIKVRIQQGAFGSTNSNDFVEQVVPNALPVTGLDVTTNTFFAGAHFSNDWIPRVPGTQTPITDQVVVIIERIAVNDAAPTTSCLNTPLQQLEGCYRFRTDPDFHTLVPGTDLKFAVPVVAGVCFQFPSEIFKKNYPFELYRSQETAEGLALATPLLNEQPTPFLRCNTFGPSSLSLSAAFRSGRLSDIAKAGWSALSRGISRIIEPKALLAVDLGAGGSTDGFSRFGYVRPATMTVSVNQATAAAGSTVQASALIQDPHDAPPTPIGGQPVTFTVTSGGGTVSTGTCPEGNSCASATGLDGKTTVTWRLGLGPNTLQASTGNVILSPVVLTVTGTPSALANYELATSGAFPLAASTGFVRDVEQCPTGKVVLGGGTQVIAEGTADFNTRLQESAPGILGAATNVWLVAIHNESANPHSVEIFATCAGAPFGYQVATTDVVIAAGSFARQTANCPAGKVVLGGGAQVAGAGTADFNTRLQESAPGIVNVNTNVWLASVRNQDQVPHTVRIFAVCASPPQGYEVVTGAITSLTAGGGFNRDVVPCPAGKVILGGGAQVVGEGTADFNTRLQESTPGLTGLNNATNVWLVSMKNLDGAAHNVRFFAVCANSA